MYIVYSYQLFVMYTINMPYTINVSRNIYIYIYIHIYEKNKPFSLHNRTFFPTTSFSTVTVSLFFWGISKLMFINN